MAERFGENEGILVFPETVCQAIPAATVPTTETMGRGENEGVQLVIAVPLETEPKNPPTRDESGHKR